MGGRGRLAPSAMYAQHRHARMHKHAAQRFPHPTLTLPPYPPPSDVAIVAEQHQQQLQLQQHAAAAAAAAMAAAAAGDQGGVTTNVLGAGLTL